MKVLKHSKFKNTGILFELLARQVTADIISNTKSSKATHLITKYFKESTELGKELKLYQLLINEKIKDDRKAEKFLDIICESRKKLSSYELSKLKFELIKEIKEHYPIKDFLNGKINNYKMQASIYKVFEDNLSLRESIDPRDLFQSRNYIIETLTGKAVRPTKTEIKDTTSIELFEQQDKDIRLLSYKLLIDSFNEKYSILDENQKNLIREYINNVSNTNSFNTYINKEIPVIKSKLSKYLDKIDDSVIKIKLTESINQLSKIKVGKIVKDGHVTALLLSYELLRELANVTK